MEEVHLVQNPRPHQSEVSWTQGALVPLQEHSERKGEGEGRCPQQLTATCSLTATSQMNTAHTARVDVGRLSV